MERRDKTHDDFIERWAEYIRNSEGAWKQEQNAFINAQFNHAFKVIEKLKKQPGGKEKLRKLYGIRNEKGFSEFY